MGVANRTLSDFWMDDATLNSTGDWQTAAAANTTSRFTMAHVRSLVSITNGSVSLAVKSNSVSTLTVSNGTFRVPLLDIGSATAGDAGPNGNGELRIHAGTVTVELATSTGYGMNLGGRAGNTGVVMLTHSAALLSITNGSRLRLGNSGSAFLIVSGGAARVVGQIRLGESVGSEGGISIYNGRVETKERLTIGFSGEGVVNLDHPNALLEVGEAIWMGDIAVAQTNGAAALNISNGTVRATTPGLDHLVGSYNQTGRCPSVVNLLNGTLDLNGGALVVGNRTRGEGTFNMSGGTAHIGRITLLGFSSATLAAATSTVAVSGGTLNLGALTTLGTTPGARSNVWLSGGTIHSTTSFLSTVNITLTNAPGPGLVTFDVDDGAVRWSGAISGPGRLRKTGAGQLELNAVNSYGGTEVAGGILAVQNRTGSGTGTGRVDVSAGGLLIGTGLVSVLHLGGGAISPGSATNLVGNLLAGQMVWTNGLYRWEVQNLAAKEWDTVAGTGALTIASGIVTIQVASVQGGGQSGPADNYDVSSGYTCVIASATSIGGFDTNKFVIDSSQFVNDEGATWSITVISTNLALVITPPVGSSRWVYWDANLGSAGIQAGSGVWTEGSNSWMVGGVAPNVEWDNSRRDKALFSYQAAGPHTVRVDMAAATNSGISMSSSGTAYHYEINGTGTLEMVGLGQSFHVEQGTANLTIGARIHVATGGLVKSGSGTLYLDNEVSDYSGGVLVKTGKLYVGKGGTRGELGGGLVTVIDGGPELYFNRSSYAITNPIAGGRTYITNSGGGYAWRAARPRTSW
jgi:fibronectin-binding autotransporter adhesin